MKNNEEIAVAQRKVDGELGIARSKIELEKERRESIIKIAQNTIWRLSLIVIGFFILRHLILRSKFARINERQLREKAMLVSLAKYDSSPAKWIVELLAQEKMEAESDDKQELIDASVKEVIKILLPKKET